MVMAVNTGGIYQIESYTLFIMKYSPTRVMCFLLGHDEFSPHRAGIDFSYQPTWFRAEGTIDGLDQFDVTLVNAYDRAIMEEIHQLYKDRADFTVPPLPTDYKLAEMPFKSVTGKLPNDLYGWNRTIAVHDQARWWPMDENYRYTIMKVYNLSSVR